MINKELIREGVIKMFKVNMGLKAGEKILVVTDVPRKEDWIFKSSREVSVFIKRTILAKTVAEIAKESFPECEVEFYVYPSTGRSGAELDPETSQKLKDSDVLIAITTYSLTHTRAREQATEAGVRVASMPGFLEEMFYPGGPMSADYHKIKEETEKIANLLTNARIARIKTPSGTEIEFSLENRVGKADTGLFTEKGAWGNLPAGEAFIAPIEGTAKGKVIVEAGWFPNLNENLTLVFKEGEVVEIIGGGEIGDKLREVIKPGVEAEPFKSRRNLAELGIGTNPLAKRPDNVLEAEKIKGTVHVAIGDNSHFGGVVSADLHQDFVLPKPSLYLDDRLVMDHGRLVI